jgi:hypothetical protein
MQPNTNYSVSVKKAISAFPEKEEISSSQIVLQLLKDHPEYGNKQAELLSLSPTNTKKTVVEWIEQVMKLFNNQNDTKQTKSTTEFVLHGRLFIIGLALIDSDLKSQLDNQGFYDAIVKELREPLEGLLATRKENLLNSASDSVPNQTDEPVIDIDEDLLGRAAFARFLARRI